MTTRKEGILERPGGAAPSAARLGNSRAKPSPVILVSRGAVAVTCTLTEPVLGHTTDWNNVQAISLDARPNGIDEDVFLRKWLYQERSIK